MNLGGGTRKCRHQLATGPGAQHTTLKHNVLCTGEYPRIGTVTDTYHSRTCLQKSELDIRDKDPVEDEFNWDYDPGWPYVRLHNIVVRISYGDKPIV